MESASPILLTARDEPPAPTLVERVGAALAQGELVCLPTETVYGIAARADRPEALERLRRLKGSDPDRPFTWHVGTRDALAAFGPGAALGPLARRLAERYWPGPLTLVLSGVAPGVEALSSEGWTALRLPAHRATAGILAALDFPVAMSSANLRGEAPLTDAESVARELDGLALVVDGGPARLSEASGVLRLGPGRFEVLREGLLPIEDLRATAGLRLLFVCTGNTCRSPMAEGSLGAEGDAALAGFGFAVASAGTMAGPGAPAADHAVDVLAARGIDLRAHRSRAATLEAVAGADRVYCLTHSHRDTLGQLLPPKAARRLQLLDPEGRDVPDPIGGPREEYERCAARIEEAIRARAVDWA